MLRNFYRKLISTRAQLMVGCGLLMIGLLVGGFSIFGLYRAQHTTAASVGQALKSNKVQDDGLPIISGNPTHIIIPSVNIDLSVIPGYYNPKSNSWTLSLNNAQYAAVSAKPNNKQGDTFIYAHYRSGVFYNLPKIQPNAEAIVTTDNGHTFTYNFRSSLITTPQDTSLFTYRGKPILVLQTCTGLWYQNRQLFTFDLVGAA